MGEIKGLKGKTMKTLLRLVWNLFPLSARNWLYWWWDYLSWRYDLRGACAFSAHPNRPRTVVLVPCDPWTVTGSRGDEAMLCAIVEAELRKSANTEFVFLAGRNEFPDINRFPRARLVYAWRGYRPLHALDGAIRALAPDALYALGADCMDGKYSSRTSMALVGAAAYASACGAEAHLTGFSFNEHPEPCLRRVFRTAAEYLAPYNLRDAISAVRFERFARVRVGLVADTAFLMSPKVSSGTEKWSRWCADERRQGRRILGINLNPMLFPPQTRANQIKTIASQLRELRLDPNFASLSYLLIPHDYRGGGDLSCLDLLMDELAGLDHVAIVRDVFSAPELKELVGAIDALFTCRMHLGIAALGRGKPIAGFAYQGKFAGLMRHFNLPESLIGNALEPERLKAILAQLMAGCDELTKQVLAQRPGVLALAQGNVEARARRV